MDRKQIREVNAVFLSLLTSQSIRLARGAAERKRVFEALAIGSDVSSYRYDWLKSAILKCVSQMGAAAHEFNQNHQFDQCSVQDLIDILEMAVERLRNG